MRNDIKVLIVGDSRKMKGGVSTVIKSMEKSRLWKKYHCRWLQCQINRCVAWKVLYIMWGMLQAVFVVPSYDIVHFHTTPGRGMKVILPIFLYSKLWHKRTIVHLHVGNQIKDYAQDGLFRWMIKQADKVIVLGKMWKDYLVGEMGVSTNVEYLYNTVTSKPRANNTKRYFLFAAYFNINKGYDTLLEAWAMVVKKYPKWQLVMCGTGNTDDVKRLIVLNDVSGSVDLPGWVDGEQRETYFRDAYAYCMTSQQEGLPMSVLESMAYGVPIITTPVGCLPEFLEDGKSALFFDFGDANMLAEKMLILIAHSDLRSGISAEGKSLVEKHFTPNVVFEKLDSIYHSLCSDVCK